MPEKIIEIKLKVDADTPHRLKDKENLMKAISNLEAEHQQRLIEIANNPKALKGLKENWTFLKGMFG